MKPPKLVLTLAAVICSFAVTSSRAQNATTNLVTFNALTFNQNPTTNDNGTTTTFGPIVKQSHGTSGQTGLLHEIGRAVSPVNGLTAAAKLVLIAPHNAQPKFAVIDGANFYDLSDTGSNIMSLSFPGNNRIKAGTQSDTTVQRSTTEVQLITINYDDTALVDGGLQFTLTGVGTVIQSDTAPVNGTYIDTLNAKITPMVGEGSSGEPFVATGSVTISGKGPLTVPPPT